MGVSLAVLAPAPGGQALAQQQSFASFSELRNAVLDRISGSTKRVWLVTDYLTDGETVTALYLAQYRKLDVKVLLGRGKANGYMSRLNYLKSQNIPVFLRPDTFRPGSATAILADDTLVRIDGELDFLAKYRKYNMSVGGQADAQSFATAYAEAARVGVPAIPAAIPLVGKPSRGGRVYAPQQPQYSHSDGAYVYGGRSPPRPTGVPERLPKVLKSERKSAAPEPRAQKRTAPDSDPRSELEPDEAPPDLKDEPGEPPPKAKGAGGH